MSHARGLRRVQGADLLAPRARRQAAAIASARAGELYGLVPLETDIQDNAGNVTRFLVLSREPLVAEPTDKRPLKTSVVFALAEGPGQLAKALSAFAMRGLALHKARRTSRILPSPNTPAICAGPQSAPPSAAHGFAGGASCILHR